MGIIADDLLSWADSLPKQKNPRAAALEKAAAALGVDAADLGSIISFETGGTFDPHRVGGEGNKYRGLIQFGPDEQRKYYRPGQTFDDQLNDGVVRYFQDRFKKAGRTTHGASLEDLYTTVIAGNPLGNRDARDVFGTSARSGTQRILKEHRPKVLEDIFGHEAVNEQDVWADIDGLLSSPLNESDIWSDVDNILRQPSPTFPTQTPKITLESPATIEAQLASALDANSPRAALLLNDASQEQLLDPALLRNLKRVQRPEGILYINESKAPDHANRSIAELLGKVRDVGQNTKGMAVVTTDADGNELSASIVNDPEEAVKQVEVDQAQFPQAAESSLKSSDQVDAERQAALDIARFTGLEPMGPPPTGRTEEFSLPAKAAAPRVKSQAQRPAPRQPRQTDQQQVQVGRERQLGKPTDNLDTVDYTVTVSKDLSPEDKLRLALSQKYTPSEIDAFENKILGRRSSPTFAQNTPPMPELPETLDAQREAMHDPASTRAGVLYTQGENLPELLDGEVDLPLPSGEVLRVNSAKLDTLSRAAGRDLAEEVMRGGDYTPLIGGKAQPTTNTAGKTAVITRDKLTGKELVASSVETPDAVETEAAMQRAQFPNRPTQTEVTNSDQIVAERTQAEPQASFLAQVDPDLAAPGQDRNEAAFRQAIEQLGPQVFGRPLSTFEKEAIVQFQKQNRGGFAFSTQNGQPIEAFKGAYTIDGEGIRQFRALLEENQPLFKEMREDALRQFLAAGGEITPQSLSHLAELGFQPGEVEQMLGWDAPTNTLRPSDFTESVRQRKAEFNHLLQVYREAPDEDTRLNAMTYARRAMGWISPQEAEEEVADLYRLKEERQTSILDDLRIGAAIAADQTPAGQQKAKELQKQREQEYLARTLQKYGTATNRRLVLEQKKKEEVARKKRVSEIPWPEYLGRSVMDPLLNTIKSAVNKGVGASLRGISLAAKSIDDAIYGEDANPRKSVQQYGGYQTADSLEHFLEWALPTNKDLQGEFFHGKLPQGVGSTIGMALGGSSKLSIAVLSSLQMGGDAYKEAIQSGATEEQAQMAGLLQAPLGVTEIFGIGKALNRLNRGAGSSVWKQAFREAWNAGKREIPEEIAQEGFQTTAGNIISQLTYDPDRKADKDLFDNMLVAGISAPLASGGVTLINFARNRHAINKLIQQEQANGAIVNVADGKLHVFGQQVEITPELQPLVEKYADARNAILSYQDQLKDRQKEARKVLESERRFKPGERWTDLVREKMQAVWDTKSRIVELEKEQLDASKAIAAASGVEVEAKPDVVVDVKPAIQEAKRVENVPVNESGQKNVPVKAERATMPFKWKGLEGDEALKLYNEETRQHLSEQKKAETKARKRWEHEAKNASTEKLQEFLGQLQSQEYNFVRQKRILVIENELRSRGIDTKVSQEKNKDTLSAKSNLTDTKQQAAKSGGNVTTVEKPSTDVEKGFEITDSKTERRGDVALKYQRDEARRQAEIDPLTGVANRRALDLALPAAENDPNTSVIAFDANNFGQINKKIGEGEGDKALKELASALATAAKEHGGRVFRKGGDEFTILAPKDNAETIRKRAEELFGEKKYDGFSVSVSGSVGRTFEDAGSRLQAEKKTRKLTQMPIREFADDAIRDPSRSEKKIIAATSRESRTAIESATGIKLGDRFRHVLTGEGIRHALARHGEGRERLSNQDPVNIGDFDKIPDIVDSPDSIQLGKPNKKGLKTIVYAKRFNGNTFYVEEVRSGKEELAMVTMYKKKSPPSPVPDVQNVSTGIPQRENAEGGTGKSVSQKGAEAVQSLNADKVTSKNAGRRDTSTTGRDIRTGDVEKNNRKGREEAGDGGKSGFKSEASVKQPSGLSNAEIAKELNRFTKSGDLHKYASKIKNFTRDEKVRVAENLRAGDEPLEAIRDAKGHEYELTDADFEGGKGTIADPAERTVSDYEALSTNENVRMLMSETPVEGYEKGKASSNAVIKSYEDILNKVGKPTPIRVGRGNFAQKKASGFYKLNEEVIRLRTANNIPTAAHEVFHGAQKYLYGQIKGSDLRSLPTPAARELVKMGRDLYGDRKPAAGYASEGWAEFGRYYLTTEDAGKVAPNMLRYFEENILPNHPEFAKALEKAKEITTEYRLQGAVNRAKADTARHSFSDNIRKAKRALDQVPTKIVDEFTPLLRLSQDAASVKGELAPSEDPYKVASFLRGGASATTHYFVFDGTLDFARNKVGAPLQDAVSMLKGKQEEFSQYLKARRAQELLAEGINPGMTKQDADALVKLYDSPEFQLAAEKIYKWNNDVLNYVKESSPEMASVVDKIFAKNWQNYVPLMREFEDAGSLNRINKAGGNPLKRIQGSGRRVKDIFPQMIANTEKLIAASHRQKVLDTIVKLSDVEGMGHIIEEVPVDKIPVKAHIEQIRGQLESMGIDVPADVDAAVTFFAPAQTPKGQDPILPIMRDGTMKWYQVDAELYNTLQGLDLYRLPKIFDVFLGMPTRAFRLGTTGLRPAFSLITNPTRDIQTFYAQSKESNPAKLTANYFTALAQALNPKRVVGKRNSDLDLFYRLGANLAQPLGADTAITRRTAKELFQGPVTRKVMHPVELARELLSVSESVPRVAEIRNIAKQINWDKESPLTFDQAVEMGLGAKQVTVDFSAAGSFGKKFNQMVPFFNANVQGTRQFAKNMTERPVRSVLYGLPVLALTLKLWNDNKDEEWYRDMPAREKFMYYNFKVGPRIIQIPKPFEWGNLFSVIPEALIDSWYTQDPEGVKAALGYIGDTSTPPVMPQVLKVAKEQWQNRIDYFDSPIVSKADEYKPLGEQTGPGTTGLADVLGEYFPNTVSPKRADHIIRGLGGGTPIDVLKLVDQVTGLKPRKAGQESDIPVIGKLFRPGGEVGYNSVAIDKFYEDYEYQQRLANSKDPELKKQSRFKEAQKVAKALKELREMNIDDPVAANRAARNALMREIARGYLRRDRSNRGQELTTSPFFQTYKIVK